LTGPRHEQGDEHVSWGVAIGLLYGASTVSRQGLAGEAAPAPYACLQSHYLRKIKTAVRVSTLDIYQICQAISTWLSGLLDLSETGLES
jgi:hypothetical protein